jgi:hypothetical protein
VKLEHNFATDDPGSAAACMPKLTPKQRQLQREIEEIAESIGMDHWNIEKYPADARTPKLGVMKMQLIRGEIITKYTLIDEFLTVIICNYYFKKSSKNTSFRRLWQTDQFQIFNHYIMDDTYLLQKMRVVRAIGEIPAEVRNAIDRINAVRNGIAHSFFPENRRQYMSHKKVVYRGQDIFTKVGIEKFREDFDVISNYCWKRMGWI